MNLGLLVRAERNRGIGVQRRNTALLLGFSTMVDRPWIWNKKIDKEGPVPENRPDLGPCWLWLGSIAGGYGRYGKGPGTTMAHRIAWEMEHGPIPDGLELDHLCRVRRCVNPSHLELVTHRENVLRGEGIAAREAVQTHCKYGHEFTPENTLPQSCGRRGRRCRECKRAEGREYQRRKRSEKRSRS